VPVTLYKNIAFGFIVFLIFVIATIYHCKSAHAHDHWLYNAWSPARTSQFRLLSAG